MPTNKHTVACRISEETYSAMLELVKGENPAYESISEYMYTLIISDLARRQSNKPDMTRQLLEALSNPEVVEKLRNLAK